MAKLESTFKNMALSLVIIAMVAAAALAGVYTLTKDTIEEQKAEKEQQAVFSVLPEQGVGAVIVDTIISPKYGHTVYRAEKDGEFIGAAVKTSAVGFGGKQNIMVGFDANGMIVDYTVLDHQETPGLGDKISYWFKTDNGRQNIVGRYANGAFQVSKEGGDVDAITAATISSRAFLKAINEAYAAFRGDEVEAATSASQVHHEEVVAEPEEVVENDNLEKEADYE